MNVADYLKNFRSRKAKTDPYLPTVKAILGQHLIRIGTTKEDQEANTDLVSPQRAIAVRIRSEGSRQYANDVTFRYRVPSGRETEWQKVWAGHGDLLFYGFQCGATNVDPWVILDLDAFRTHGDLRPTWEAQAKSNRDGTSFIPIDVTKLPEGCIFAWSIS